MTIKELRKSAGLTQEEMASRLGITRVNYILREQRKTGWKADEIAKFKQIVEEERSKPLVIDLEEFTKRG